MKRLYIVAAILSVALVSCTQEDEVNSVSGEKEIIITAYRENTVKETRTIQDSNGSIFWSLNEDISVFYHSGSNGGSKFTSTNSSIAKQVDFIGTITAITGVVEGDAVRYFYGIYPHNLENAVNADGSIVTVIPDVQIGKANTFADNHFVSIGKSRGLEMGFNNLCGGFWFTLNREGVTKVTLRGNSEEILAGKVKVVLDDNGKPQVNEILDGKSELVMTCPDGAAFQTGVKYYFVMRPVTFENGFTFTMETEDGYVGVRKVEVPIEILRSYFSYSSSAIDTGVEYKREGNIVFADSAVKAICVENWDANGDGELSYDEAAAVTDIGDYFIGTDITSFDEFKYFTGVTSIWGSYKNCTSLTSIDIPNSVISIEVATFKGCSSLSRINLPEGLTSMGSVVFSGCYSLKAISLPSTLTQLDHTSLTDNGIEKVECYLPLLDGYFADGKIYPSYLCRAFMNDYDNVDERANIKEIVIKKPSDTDTYGLPPYALARFSGAETISFPDGMISIGNNAFDFCKSLTSFEIQETVTTIGNSAFQTCTGLTRLVIPDTVISIGESAFYLCSGLTSIHIPDSVTSIELNTFRECSGLTSIIIPDGVTYIKFGAFYGCSSLNDVIISDGVTTIGGSAFQNCTALSGIFVNPVTPPIGGTNMFQSTNDCPIYVPAGTVDTYKSAEVWIEYADRIHAIPGSAVPEAIDLGSGVGTWASFNIGANTPEEVGSPFAWGEVETKSEFGWDTYKWFKDDGICKYYNYAYTGSIPWTGEGERGDDLIVLEDADDAAATIWGSEWRMPTKLEIDNLLEKCDWEWTQLNNVWGYQVKSQTNDNSIFLPATGSESTGYWTSSYFFDNMPPVQDNAAHAYCLVISEGNKNRTHVARYLGYYIRPKHR